MLTVLIVDDEPLARERLRFLLEDIRSTHPTHCLGEASDGNGALLLCQEHHADILFLDISMPLLDGLHVAQRLQHKQDSTISCPHIIFTTAHRDHACDAFELAATDYLMKPIRRERLIQALEKVRSQTPLSATQHLTSTPFSFKIADKAHLSSLPFSEILFFRAEHKYTTLITTQDSYIIEFSLADIEKQYEQDVIRIHRNCLIVRQHLAELKHTSEGWHVRLTPESTWLEVSRRQVPLIKSLFPIS
jgi:two-component system, LytTR family, response regulator AlgR